MKSFFKLREELGSCCDECEDDSLYGSVEEDFEPTGEEQYEDWEDSIEEGNGLWANIHAKRQRIKAGSGEHMREPGSKGAPTTAALKRAAESVQEATYTYKPFGGSLKYNRTTTGHEVVGTTNDEQNRKGANILKHKNGGYFAASGSSTRQEGDIHKTPEAAAKAFHAKRKEKLVEAETPLSYILKNPGKKLPMHLDPNRPFDPDMPRKNPVAKAGKYGQGFSIAKHLAKQGMASVNKQKIKETHDQEYQASYSDNNMESLRNWKNEVPAQYAEHLMKTFGAPDYATNDFVIWKNTDGFKRIEIKDEYVMHTSPEPHYDYCYSFIDLKVPHTLATSLADCSESILIDFLKNEVGARCASLAANAVTLNFVMDVVAGRTKPTKEEYESRIMKMHNAFDQGKTFEIDWWPDESHDTDPNNSYYAEDTDNLKEAKNLAQQAAIAIAMKKAGKKPKNVDEAKYQKLSSRQKFTNSLARAGYDVNASSKRIQDLLAKQKKEREEKEKQSVAEGDSRAKYKVKSIGKDSKGDYYMSPSTGKKVYKSGVNKGDHENPKTGEIKKRVAEGSLTEMDKSSPQPGRDGKVSHKTYGSRDNYKLGDPERMAKQVSAEKAKKDALDILKKQGVAEGIELQEAEKNGKKVQLNKPFRTSDGKGKFAVYTKNDKGNVVKVNFGDTTGLTIKTGNPNRRRSFRARHNCDDPGPRHKARYWACKSWSKDTVSAGLGI